MDQNALSILLGLITNGLTSLLSQLGHKAGNALIGKEFIEKWELEKTSLSPILDKATKIMIANMQQEDFPNEEIVCLFLLSPEVNEIVRQIYSIKLLENKRQSDLELIRKVFLTTFSFFLDSYPSYIIKLENEERTKIANILFDTLLKGCSLALDHAIDEGILAAHEAKSTFRYRILLDEVIAVQKRLDFLIAHQQSDIQSILTFEKKFRQQISNRHKDIIPPYLDTVKRIPVNKIYVYPRLARYSDKKKEEEKKEEIETLDLSRFLSGIFRAVILGNPGAGKSTLALKICHEFTTRSTKYLLAGRKHVTPILVILREYGAEKKARNCSILQYITTKANATYQVQPPPGAFEYLLLNGRALVIFDGLDELLDTNYRQEVSGDVESFCNLYPSVPVLITSREVGYEQAPLDEDKFPVFYLTPFDEHQVKEYTKKWFDVTYRDFPKEQCDQKAKAFLEESKLVPDLRSNPLMLALMCNIYRGESYLPRNRPDVYEKCAVMLFERWDKSRGIRVTLPFDWHLRPIMEYLAFWIFNDEKLRGGVTEAELIMKTTEYIFEWLFDDYNKAEQAAQDFIDFCTGRAWVFTDTGTKREGERLYQFTHTTFLEYFTASHLVRIHRDPYSLMEFLLPRIAKEEWDVMAQLAFQLQNKKTAGAGDEILSGLIENASKASRKEAWSLLSFTTRCLEFIIPRPKVTRKIIKASIDQFIIDGIDWSSKRRTIHKDKLINVVINTIFGLRRASLENTVIVHEYTTCYVIDIINGDDELKASLALELSFYGFSWATDSIYANCSARVEAICSHNFDLCYDAVEKRMLPIANLINCFGSSGIFRKQNGILLSRVSLGQLFARRILDAPHVAETSLSKWVMNHINILNDLGSSLLPHLPIIINIPETNTDLLSDFWFRVDLFPNKVRKDSLTLEPQALFAAFILLAILLEAQEKWGNREVHNREILIPLEEKIHDIKISKCFCFDFMRWVFCARFEKVNVPKVDVELDKCGFTELQSKFIWQWIKREFDLVKMIKP